MIGYNATAEELVLPAAKSATSRMLGDRQLKHII
jgi:hypothetical protein